MALRAVQFGAGNIGRGFLGQLFFETGYETTFVDVVPEVIEGLNRRRAYPLRVVEETSVDLTIGHVSAIHAGDVEAIAEALAQADLAATAVGVNVLPRIAPALAAGVARRFAQGDAPALNFIVCENMLEAGPFLREKVREHLDPRFYSALDEKVGFVEASIGRMVPVMTAEQRAEDPLLVCVEPYCHLPVDACGFKGAIPPLKHMEPLANFGAYVERKLFVHNAGHASTAYLGYFRGHEYIWQAISDPVVRSEVDAAMQETCAGLVKKHGLDAATLREHWADLVHRFHNRALGDTVARVAKDPIRKLGPRDRLIGSALMCLEQGIAPKHVAFAAAAAIRYDHPDDAAAQQVQQAFRERGLAGVLEQYCQVPAGSALAGLVEEGMDRLQAEGWLKK
ncbi:MAG TPA: mannitol-1-phosphate 5-dehydrogenase [Candidatus Hydrogenedentes bacterium]|nr:mannitol-1-phosphate 5-dehydrogenase [Candidatus Hydrogenedentota bacterium]HOS01568.1 mannitol-1-phosphate 5-dehydrogenase [Candidatus Hydrogenedentota bacterium]